MQSADDAIKSCVDLSYFVFVLTRGFYNTAGTRVDYSGDTAGLGVKKVGLAHDWVLTFD
jgi:hypothetical protein